MDALVVAVADPKIAADLFRYDPQFEDVDAKMRAVMQNRVNAGVRAKYESENIKNTLWLFNNRECYGAIVKPALIDELVL